jgi:hypothetical protein
LSWGGGI